MKAWFGYERDQGMFVDREDVFKEYDERVRMLHSELVSHRDAGKPLAVRDHRILSSAALHLRSTNPLHKRCVENHERKKELGR